MRLGPIVLRLRAANTRFGNRIAGAAELATALRGTLQKEMAFVIPLLEDPNPNEYDNSINQKVTERFAVVVALQSDSSQSDKLGITAYDSLHAIRQELFENLLGWLMTDAEDVVSYGGGRLLFFDRAYLWFQFEFVTAFMIRDYVAEGDTDWLDTIYAQLEMVPSANIPITTGLPASLFTPDMTTLVDFTSNPDIDGGFSVGFSEKFDVYQG